MFFIYININAINDLQTYTQDTNIKFKVRESLPVVVKTKKYNEKINENLKEIQLSKTN